MSVSRKPLESHYLCKLERFFGIKDCLFEYNPGNYVMTPDFAEYAEQILNFEVKKDDVWVISYPRTGSTWCQEMVWLIGNNLNFDDAKKTIQLLRAPVLELSSILVTERYKDFMKNYGNSIDFVTKLPSPRFIKSHLPLDLLPVSIKTVKPKIVYIARSPTDVCVSYYYHCQHLYDLKCTFDEFSELFLHGKVPVGPIWSHYFDYWGKRNDENVLFLKYEDMKRDLKAVILQTASFLEKSLSDKQIDDLCEYLNFSNMKNNRSVNFEPILGGVNNAVSDEDGSMSFIRKGQVDDWKNCMKPELSQKFQTWIYDNEKASKLSF